MNDTVNALPLPLLLVAVLCGFVALVKLSDRTRTRGDETAGNTAAVLGTIVLALAIVIAVTP